MCKSITLTQKCVSCVREEYFHAKGKGICARRSVGCRGKSDMRGGIKARQRVIICGEED